MNTIAISTAARCSVTRHTHRVPMRDGIRLATDVYLPARTTGALPVLLERTPYGKDAETRRERTAANPAPLGTIHPCCSDRRVQFSFHIVEIS